MGIDNKCLVCSIFSMTTGIATSYCRATNEIAEGICNFAWYLYVGFNPHVFDVEMIKHSGTDGELSVKEQKNA